MAALGKTPISLYYTPTPATAPSASNLVLGEVALNIGDSNLYYLDPTATTVLKFSPDTAKGIAGGAANEIPVQSGAGATTFITAPTVASTYLQWNGSAFAWATAGSGTSHALTINNSGTGGTSPQTFDGTSAVTISYNTVGAPGADGTGASGTWGININGYAGSIYGGANGSLPYQTATSTTGFLSIGSNGQVLTSNGSDPTWASYAALTIGTGLSGSSYTPASAATISIANTGVTANTYGSSTAIPVLTINAQGQITSASTATFSSPSYQGTWDASANSPSLPLGSPPANQSYWIVSVAGTTTVSGISDWQVGDWIIYSSALSAYEKISGSNTESFSNIAVTSLTGYMYANGTSNVSASTTIPNTAITGLGTMSTQSAGAVAITGGTIDGTAIGSTTASTVRGSTITATTQFTGAGTGLTGTAASLSIGGNAATATTATSATTATNVAGGATDEILYQTGAGATGFITAPSGTTNYLGWNGSNFVWTAPAGSGTTTNAVTFNNSGTGAASGTSFNGSTAYTISYNTLGASPLAGSTSLTTLGTISTGVWNGTAITNTYLANSSITFGSTAASLGSTVTNIDGVAIGASTASTGAFTTLSASSTVSGTGFSTYLASPPAIGGTAPNAGYFTTLNATSGISGGTF